MLKLPTHPAVEYMERCINLSQNMTKHPDNLDSSILCSISEDEIALNLPVKYLRSRLSNEEISELLEKSADFIAHQVQ